jgi:hypothetical protein
MWSSILCTFFSETFFSNIKTTDDISVAKSYRPTLYSLDPDSVIKQPALPQERAGESNGCPETVLGVGNKTAMKRFRDRPSFNADRQEQQ